MTTFKLTIILLMVGIYCNAQKYYTRSGITEFKATEKTFEPIEATNKSSTVILDSENGDIVAQIFIASFEFENALMQEHFNENYMESSLYPKGLFKGKIENFSKNKLNDTNEFNLNGTLTIRGKEKRVSSKVNIKEVNRKLILKTSFKIKPEDFNIEIPSIVEEKISKQIQIKILYELIEKK